MADKPAVKGKGNFLTRKAGPLPAYGWAVLLLATYLAYKHFHSSASSSAAQDLTGTGAGQTSAGGASGSAGPTGTTNNYYYSGGTSTGGTGDGGSGIGSMPGADSPSSSQKPVRGGGGGGSRGGFRGGGTIDGSGDPSLPGQPSSSLTHSAAASIFTQPTADPLTFQLYTPTSRPGVQGGTTSAAPPEIANGGDPTLNPAAQRISTPPPASSLAGVAQASRANV